MSDVVAPIGEKDSGGSAGIQAFTFGDPVPVLSGSELLDYMEAWFNGRWYEPPISFDGLAKSFHAISHHEAALQCKAQMLASMFRPHKLLSRDAFGALALDFLTFGNCYLERRTAVSRVTLSLRHAPAKYVRRGEALDRYFFVKGWKEEQEFVQGSVWHLRQYDINQEVYGLPTYLAALQSAWLNESATLFRRKYYNNGSHAGFILYVSDPAQQQQDIDSLRDALKGSKGLGNFKNLFFYSPNGKKDGVQLIPVADVSAKDEFFNIKNVSRDDVLAAHRIPPQLLGIIPANAGGFGDVVKATQVFLANELFPIQQRFVEFNAWVGEEVIRFDPHPLAAVPATPAAPAA